MTEPFTRQTLQRHVALPQSIERTLEAATTHALDTAGSYIRANIAMNVALSCGMPRRKAEALGASIELFHLASLVLDDLPCMDNSDLRRSQACTHRAYGEGAAILAALGFINRAYALFWELSADVPKSAQREACRLLEESLGFVGILDGQSKDIHYAERPHTADEVMTIARQKTGSLLRLCLLLPAILAEASRYEKLHLARLSDSWGQAYQIADDLKDIFLGESSSGKTAQRDATLGRPNMALAIGELAAADLLKGLLRQAEASIQALSASEDCHAAEALLAFQATLNKKAAPLIAAHLAA